MSRLLTYACLALFFSANLSAREWQSAKGQRSLHADFVAMRESQVLLRLPDGKTTVLSISALSADDAEFARLAQASLTDATAQGPQTLQVQTVLALGAIARLGSKAPSPDSPWIFAGETIYLLPSAEPFEKGARIEARPLFPAGQRTFVPLDAEPVVIRAFALELEQAAATALEQRKAAGGDPSRLIPQIAEPMVQIVTTRGLAIALGKGYYLAESRLLKGATHTVLHENAKDYPVKVIKADNEDGISLLKSEFEMEPIRLLPREPAQIGQNIFAISLCLTSARKNLAPPSLSRGIVSQTGSSSCFQHDAAIDPNCIGGYLMNDRWEVLGVFFRPESRIEVLNSGPRSSAKTVEASTERVEALHSRSLDQCLFEGEKGAQRRLKGVPTPRSGSLGDTPKVVIERLRASTALIIASREEKRDPPARKTTAVSGSTSSNDAQPAFSMSSSGIRHNRTCRYFNASKPCQANEGKPCKLCGG